MVSFSVRIPDFLRLRADANLKHFPASKKSVKKYSVFLLAFLMALKVATSPPGSHDTAGLLSGFMGLIHTPILGSTPAFRRALKVTVCCFLAAQDNALSNIDLIQG